ncbi:MULTISPECIES: hypothetical protein [Azospirillum]|jgi:hypothetical protein|uniref:Uncharacterized protein n=1 Tax=Azospirillum brasilense TaxID=192 RepID=A0ABU4PBL4_AZOBR|nr:MULTISPECIES: hypothetical protein [Azospirillum]MDW7552608.1 hypothetical protein [Azospirillum brasilense]MDW7592200.1 hypothetical protein [Azospirillum brasilense]MDW7627331.1 hypothetical protein [Azospirillum brasilense]MDX5954980.1 hypothetical protein [Azospirillum brasilense]
MSEEKFAELVDLLDVKTADSSLLWYDDGSDSRFFAQLGAFSIRIYRVSLEFGDDFDIYIEIVDENGDVIDSFSDLSLKDLNTDKINYYRKMNKLYVAARRSAKGADKAIDSVISELKKK